MTSHASIESVAAALLHAYRTRKPVEPPRESLPSLDLEGAYRIQLWQEEKLKADGTDVVGRKIGLTSLAMQQQLGVDSPDFGFFTEDLVWESGADIEVSRFISPKVEPELAFILERDLLAEVTLDDVREAVASVHLAIEIIDSRVRDWDIRLVDTVADNASCGAVIIDHTPVDVPLDELTEVIAEMSVGGQLAGSGRGSDVMGDPLQPLVWLAGVLGHRGAPLKAGDIILTGSFCGAAPVNRGESVIVDFGPLGTISASFV